ncbi:MAG: hypothetical protein ACPL6D_04110 [Thermodesulfobacteriota bacterium]
MEYRAEKVSLEYMLVGDIVKKYPQAWVILEKYFGKNCLNKSGFKIQSLGMACILLGINQKRLLQDFEKIGQ